MDGAKKDTSSMEHYTIVDITETIKIDIKSTITTIIPTIDTNVTNINKNKEVVEHNNDEILNVSSNEDVPIIEVGREREITEEQLLLTENINTNILEENIDKDYMNIDDLEMENYEYFANEPSSHEMIANTAKDLKTECHTELIYFKIINGQVLTNVQIGDKRVIAQINTGHPKSYIKRNLVRKLTNKEFIQLSSDVDILKIKESDKITLNCNITVSDYTKAMEFLIIPKASWDIVLGVDFINIFNVSLTYCRCNIDIWNNYITSDDEVIIISDDDDNDDNNYLMD